MPDSFDPSNPSDEELLAIYGSSLPAPIYCSDHRPPPFSKLPDEVKARLKVLLEDRDRPPSPAIFNPDLCNAIRGLAPRVLHCELDPSHPGWHKEGEFTWHNAAPGPPPSPLVIVSEPRKSEIFSSARRFRSHVGFSSARSIAVSAVTEYLCNLEGLTQYGYMVGSVNPLSKETP